MKRTYTLRLRLGVVLLALVSGNAAMGDQAGDIPATSDSFTIRAGAFVLSNINTKVSLTDSAGQIGTEVNMGEDLGFKTALNVFRLDAEWQFAERHKIDAAYFSLDRSTRHVIDTSIEWGDEVYPISTTIEARFLSTVGKLNYGYTFYRTADQQVTGLIGAHVTQVKAEIRAVNLGKPQGVSTTAPLPVVGLEWKSRLTERLKTQISYSYFGISVDGRYDGSLSDFQAIANYQISDHWYIGTGFNRFTMRVTIKDQGDRLKLSTKHEYNGILAFIAAGF